ncbi:MAG: ribonuclease HI [Gammaproteobacteria bacterium]|nr:ribonuclease HI [Gammaproteobacteria bacterium]
MGEVEIYTDGACRGNPGPGGWAAVLRVNGKERILRGAETLSTNNRMELTAAVRALNALTQPCHVILYTDSEYVQRGISEWLPAWKARGWKTASKKAVKNQDLWQQLDAVASRHQVDWQWVRGHAGNAGNEHVDRLANAAIDEMLSGDTWQ